MKSAYSPIRVIAKAAVCAFFCVAQPRVHAAEFEVLDKFSVDGYSVLRGSADIPGGSFAVGGSTLAVKGGDVGIGTAAPGATLDIKTGPGNTYAVKISSSDGVNQLMVVQHNGNVGIGTTGPVASLDVAGGIKAGTVTAGCTTELAGTIRWTSGHLSVCTGTDWRQLDNQLPPAVSSINPLSGLITGGTLITISGSGFSFGLKVKINDVEAAVSGVTSSQITATTPAGSGTGTKDVIIMGLLRFEWVNHRA